MGAFAAGGPAAPDRWFGRDKAQHFTVSFMMAGSAGYAARHRWNRGRAAGVEWGFGAAISAGILKEIFDRWRPGHQASLRDLAADVAGAAAGCVLVSWW
jgi:putative lipoprotein